MRGRVMGLYMLVFLGGAPLGSPLVGWAAEQFGARMSLIGGGVISALAAVVAALLLARARDVPARSYLRPAAPAAPPRPAPPAPAAPRRARPARARRRAGLCRARHRGRAANRWPPPRLMGKTRHHDG